MSILCRFVPLFIHRVRAVADPDHKILDLCIQVLQSVVQDLKAINFGFFLLLFSLLYLEAIAEHNRELLNTLA